MMGTELWPHSASSQSLYYAIMAYLYIYFYVTLFNRQVGYDLLTVVTHSYVVKRKPKFSEEHNHHYLQGERIRQANLEAIVPLKHRAFSECYSITSVKNELSITK
jgi:hypothetical protein